MVIITADSCWRYVRIPAGARAFELTEHSRRFGRLVERYRDTGLQTHRCVRVFHIHEIVDPGYERRIHEREGL